MIKTIRIGINSSVNIKDSIAACIGYFDGFHLGHQGLFNATIKAAKNFNYRSAIISFDPDPWVVIKNMTNIEHIMSLEDRISEADKLGFDYFIILEFNKEMSSLCPNDFVNELLLPLNIKYLVCGFDFHFGKMGQGDVSFLKQLNLFKVEEIKEIDYDNEKISTTRINKLIEEGNIELANVLLTRPYKLNGKVKHGSGLGHKFGIPTANVELSDYYIMPKKGVYAGMVEVIGKRKMAVINVGHNPTYNEHDYLTIEPYILDFNEEIYDEEISVELHKFLRDEKKFESIEALINKIRENEAQTREYFEEHKHE